MTGLLQIHDLGIAYGGEGGWTNVVEGVSFDIGRGEAFGLVGESGCGKSTVAYRLLGYGAGNSRVQTGEVLFEGVDLLTLDARSLSHLRGNRIALVPQNPTTALSPGMRVGSQLREMIDRHRALPRGQRMSARIAELFSLVGLPQPELVGRRYPHELSGGQQQRVTIAMAIACNPDLLVLDEPTTGLDVTTQRQIIQLLSHLRESVGMAMLYVTHDLALLAQIADRIGVMYAGALVETAPCEALLSRPAHPYTKGLIASIPTKGPEQPAEPRLPGMLERRKIGPGCKFEPRCCHAIEECRTTPQVLVLTAAERAVACMRWPLPVLKTSAKPQGAVLTSRPPKPMLSINGLTLSYAHAGRLQGLFRNPPPPVVRDIDLDLRPGEILALVGESGSGKSTIARAISGRLRPRSGSISFEGHLLEPTVAQRQQAHLREIQYIFQNPDASLNPRRDVRAILERPLRHFGMDAKPDVLQTALESVRLPSGYLDRFPDQLSGGERQRIAIARALLAEPKLFICDEILSALDVSVQATIVDLLSSLRAERGVAMLFISHDLAVVRKLADRVAVLYQGELMQIGDKSALQGFPLHPYTEMLLRAAPDLHRDGYVPRLPAMPQSRALPGTGCPLAGRCPRQVGTVCAQVRPPLLPISGGFIRCHIPVAELGIVTE